MHLNKKSIAVFNPQHPLEAAVQDAFFAIGQRWLNAFEVKSFIQGVVSLGGIVEDFLASPQSMCRDFFEADSSTDYVYFPCYTIELRNILRSKKYISSPHILGFTLNTARKALRHYPVLLAVDIKKAGDFNKLRGIMIFENDTLDLEGSVRRVYIRERLDSREMITVQNIVREEYSDASVHSLAEVPGVQTPKIAQVRFLHKYVVNISSVGITNDVHKAATPEEAVQIALDKAWRATGNPHKGAEFSVETYKNSPFWAMVVREAKSGYNAPMKTAQNNPVTPTALEKQIFDFILGVNKKYNLGLTFRVAGGWVRDKALGKESDDIDIAIDKMTGAEFGKYIAKEIGKSGNVIKANPDQSKHLETMTINLFGRDVDFVNLRSESYGDSRIPEMQFGSPEVDADRRDLTINAMFYNINAGKIEDFTGKGLSDLQTMTLRTPLDPKKTFMDDPLRILRMLRFYSRYGGAKIDPSAIAAMKDPEVQAALKAKVSPERIATEVKKLMSGEKPEEASRILQQTGLMKAVFEVPEMAGFHEFEMDQHNPHHIDNVFEHTLKVMAELNKLARQNKVPDEKRALMLFAALFHDIGKLCPTIIGIKTVKQVINGLETEVPIEPKHQTYHGHEDISANVVKSIMEKLKMSGDDINYVVTLVQEHMEPHKGKSYWNDRNIRKYLNQFGTMWMDIFNHAVADAKSKGETPEVQEDVAEKAEIMNRMQNMPPPPPKPVLDGRALMSLFPDLDPASGFIKEIHGRLMNMQFENPQLTPEAATQAVQSIAGEIRARYALLGKGKRKGPVMQQPDPQPQSPIQSGWYGQIKEARDMADWLCGHVVRKPFGTGSKSESLQNFLVLADGSGEYLLRRSEGPAFGDPELEELVGRSICCKGMIHNHLLIVSEFQIQGDVTDENVQYMTRQSPAEMSKFEVGDKVRRRGKGLAFPQLSGRVQKIEGDLMFIKWDKVNELEAIRLTDTVALYGTLQKV